MYKQLYSESLCPDCIAYVAADWWDVWNTKGVGYGSSPGDGEGIVSWNQVVYGNAKTAGTKITCQVRAPCRRARTPSAAPSIAAPRPAHAVRRTRASHSRALAYARPCAPTPPLTFLTRSKVTLLPFPSRLFSPPHAHSPPPFPCTSSP